MNHEAAFEILRRCRKPQDDGWCLDCGHADIVHEAGRCGFFDPCECQGFVSELDYAAAVASLESALASPEART